MDTKERTAALAARNQDGAATKDIIALYEAALAVVRAGSSGDALGQIPDLADAADRLADWIGEVLEDEHDDWVQDR